MSPLPPESHRTDIPFPYLTLFRSRSGAAVAQLPQALQVMQRDRRSDRQINEAFGHFIALKVGDGVGRQMEADVADQHQAAARKRQRSTARRAVAAVALQRPLQLPALLSEAGGKIGRAHV